MEQDELSIRQALAVEEILAGRTDAEVAAAVGVHRVTVSRWRLRDPVFVATLNRRRAEVLEAARDRLRTLIPSALEVVASEIQQGNWRVGLAVLKVLGPQLWEIANVGSGDPQAVLDRLALDRHRSRLLGKAVPAATRLDMFFDHDETAREGLTDEDDHDQEE